MDHDRRSCVADRPCYGAVGAWGVLPDPYANGWALGFVVVFAPSDSAAANQF
jgi:hypothetical protein